eukprot:COSAG02_NODE_3034_length_7504_cov_13.653477_8_plen_64_part_01
MNNQQDEKMTFIMTDGAIRICGGACGVDMSTPVSTLIAGVSAYGTSAASRQAVHTDSTNPRWRW